VSALSGCLTSHPDEECKATGADGLCNDPDALEFNLRHHITFLNASVWCPTSSTADSSVDERAPSPFLFDIARDAGYISLFGEEFCFEDSPYVTQGNIFELSWKNNDIAVHRVHCRLASRYLVHKNLPVERLWSGKTGFHLPCVDGNHGTEKSVIPFEHIEQMWEQYSDMPRFAFLNAMAAHDYAARWNAMPQNSEVYDRQLCRFLQDLMSRPDASNTVIVLRSDHGLQDGPSISDFSTQVEHSRPWTEIILPESLPTISLKALKTNQERMASGFDLYNTLRNLMAPTSSAKETMLPAVPPWSINLLSKEIPEGRTCLEGKIPQELCRNENEKTFLAPSFATCNKFDQGLRFFCPKMAKGERIKVRVIYADGNQQINTTLIEEDQPMLPADGNQHNKTPKRGRKRKGKRGKAQKRMKRAKRTPQKWEDIDEKTQIVEQTYRSMPPEELLSSWQSIDAQVAAYPQARVSGGIFLYPRQQVLFSEIVDKFAKGLASHPGRPLRICETGFGAGHSAALFLAASPNTVVVSFDRFDRPYQKPAAQILLKKYPTRFTTITGNSCLTVPETLSSKWNPEPVDIRENGELTSKPIQCDLLHGSSLCLSDNTDLVQNSPPGALLTSTSMGSLEDKEVYFGPKAQWTGLRANGCIRDITCFAEEDTEVKQDFIFSRRGNKMRHKFCIAIVTGKCTANSMTSSNTSVVKTTPRRTLLSSVTESLDLKNIYPQYQVKPPAQGANAGASSTLGQMTS